VRPVGRLHHLIVDTPDPARSAEFWAAVLGRPITYRDDDFVVVAESDRASGMAFQRSSDHVPPTWPAAGVPQQMHLDVMVDDVEAAAARVVGLGARRLSGNVFADPAGHPFCLVPRPGWADPVGEPAVGSGL
jgi:catechol 2,3-dioxygenase-like lactoylglutathione lyase family enzyme